MKKDIANAAKSALKSAKKFIIKRSPEIKVGIGIFATTAATIALCKESVKASKQIEHAKEVIADISNDERIEHTEEDIKKVKTKTALTIVKDFAFPVITYGLGTFSTVDGILEYRGRYRSLAGGYVTLSQMYKKLQDNIKEKYGEDALLDAKYGLETKKVTTEETDEDGKVKKVKKDVKVLARDPRLEGYSDYARIFSKKTSSLWRPDHDANMAMLQMEEYNLNQILRTRKIDQFGLTKRMQTLDSLEPLLDRL